jgi:hypothetical protein
MDDNEEACVCLAKKPPERNTAENIGSHSQSMRENIDNLPWESSAHEGWAKSSSDRGTKGEEKGR